MHSILVLLTLALLLTFLIISAFLSKSSPASPFSLIAISGHDCVYYDKYSARAILGPWEKSVMRAWHTVSLIDDDRFRAVKKKELAIVLTEEELSAVTVYLKGCGAKICVFRNNGLADIVRDRAQAQRVHMSHMLHHPEQRRRPGLCEDDSFVSGI